MKSVLQSLLIIIATAAFCLHANEILLAAKTFISSLQNDAALLKIYIVLQAAFTIAINPVYLKNLKSIDTKKIKIVLRTDRNLHLIGYLSLAVEYWILNRYSFFGYKNSLRVNARIFSSFMVALFPLSVAFALGFNLGETSWIGVLGLFGSHFAIERSSVYKKWEHLAAISNTVLAMEHGFKRDALEVAMVIDVIEMEMWSHRSYEVRVGEILVKAAAIRTQAYPFKISKSKYFEDNPIFENLTKSDAIKILTSYQDAIITGDKIDVPYKMSA